MKKILSLALLLAIVGCSSTPVGHVVSETGPNTFHVNYPSQELRVGDRVKIIRMEMNSMGEYAPPAKKEIIGEGKVSSILNGNFYEITTESAQHVPSDAFVQKF
jgi:hypothetical protein